MIELGQALVPNCELNRLESLLGYKGPCFKCLRHCAKPAGPPDLKFLGYNLNLEAVGAPDLVRTDGLVGVRSREGPL